MSLISVKRDLDNAVIGKIELSTQALSALLAHIYDWIDSINERLIFIEDRVLEDKNG